MLIFKVFNRRTATQSDSFNNAIRICSVPINGAEGYHDVAAHHNSELGEAVEKTLAMDGPVICEIFVDMKQGFEPKAAAKMLPDGTMVSVPLEDLAPFLPEEELKENMIIPLVENK